MPTKIQKKESLSRRPLKAAPESRLQKLAQTFYERMQSPKGEYGKYTQAETGGRQLSEVCSEIHEPRKRINIQLCFVFVFLHSHFFFLLCVCVCVKSMALAKQNRDCEGLGESQRKKSARQAIL